MAAPRGTLLVSGTGGTPPWPNMAFRLSAHPADRRILAKGAVAAGTYLVPALDIAFVNTGLGAVGRYALPNPLPAVHRWSVNLSGVPYDAGTVRPAHGQAGGGTELVNAGKTGPGTAFAVVPNFDVL